MMQRRITAAGNRRATFIFLLGFLVLFTSSISIFAQYAPPVWSQENETVYLSNRTIRHIEDRHWPDSSAQGAGKYAPGITVQSLRSMIEQTVAVGQFRMNTQGRPGRIYEYDFGNPIGTKINGAPATRLRVVVNMKNQVVTAFPF